MITLNTYQLYGTRAVVVLLNVSLGGVYFYLPVIGFLMMNQYVMWVINPLFCNIVISIKQCFCLFEYLLVVFTAYGWVGLKLTRIRIGLNFCCSYPNCCCCSHTSLTSWISYLCHLRAFFVSQAPSSCHSHMMFASQALSSCSYNSMFVLHAFSSCRLNKNSIAMLFSCLLDAQTHRKRLLLVTSMLIQSIWVW